jgi:hypothetical protein
MSNILDYKGKQLKYVLDDFQSILEDNRSSQNMEEYIIETDDYEVQGALLNLIDELELEHRIELGGKIYVTIG